MIDLKPIAAICLVLCLPSVARAEDDTATVLPNQAQPRFFSLDDARSGRPHAKPDFSNKGVVHAPLRSDSAAMSNGFLRIDRPAATPQQLQHALIVKPQPAISAAPRIISGAPTTSAPPLAMTQPSISTPTSNDPVLSLFNSAGPLPSFRDTLLGKAGSTAGPAPTNTQMPSLNRYNWPIPTTAPQKISSTFGYRPDPIDHHTEFHSGIDISAAKGTPVLASADGQVEKVGNDGPYGQSISIRHTDGSESQYSHLSAENVTAGQQVRSGQPIGAVGDTGRATGAHLDYRISQNGTPIDPLSVLAAPNTAQTAQINTHPLVTNPHSERLIVVR